MKLFDYVFNLVAGLGVKHFLLVTGGGPMHLSASLAAEKRTCAMMCAGFLPCPDQLWLTFALSPTRSGRPACRATIHGA